MTTNVYLLFFHAIAIEKDIVHMHIGLSLAESNAGDSCKQRVNSLRQCSRWESEQIRTVASRHLKGKRSSLCLTDLAALLVMFILMKNKKNDGLVYSERWTTKARRRMGIIFFISFVVIGLCEFLVSQYYCFLSWETSVSCSCSVVLLWSGCFQFNF